MKFFWQFFIAKLDALEEKENQWSLFAMAPNPEIYLKNTGLAKAPAQFTHKDHQTKERLLNAGYSNWSKKDLFLFIRQCESYGRKDIPNIAAAFPQKTIEEVKEYSDAFWKKYQLIENGQKYVDRIEKGEAEIERYRSIHDAITQKHLLTINDYKSSHPDDQDCKHLTADHITLTKLPPPTDKRSLAALVPPPNPLFDFTDEEDLFLAYCLFKFGYGAWELMRNEYRNTLRFRFNWVALSRSVSDIQKRCDQLVLRFKKELQVIREVEEAKKAKEEKKKGESKKGKRKRSQSSDDEEVVLEERSEDESKGKKGKKGAQKSQATKKRDSKTGEKTKDDLSQVSTISTIERRTTRSKK